MTAGQREVLEALVERPRSAEQVMTAVFYLRPTGAPRRTTDSVRACLRRLEDRELVRRISDPPDARWQLTAAGRDALA